MNILLQKTFSESAYFLINLPNVSWFNDKLLWASPNRSFISFFLDFFLHVSRFDKFRLLTVIKRANLFSNVYDAIVF